jgi:hypothetical protein
MMFSTRFSASRSFAETLLSGIGEGSAEADIGQVPHIKVVKNLIMTVVSSVDVSVLML